MTSEQIGDARAWCADCFSDTPDDVTDDEVVDCVRRQYDGGLAGFIADGRY
jgi:hypothetical protein